MSYRLVNANVLAEKYPEVNNMPCIYADLPNGLDNKHYDLRKWQTDYESHEAFGWCKGCKEYDAEKHCCHRYSSFIRESLQDSINAVLEDIKADFRKAISDFAMDNGDTAYGLRIALYIIDNHISGKEQ